MKPYKRQQYNSCAIGIVIQANINKREDVAQKKWHLKLCALPQALHFKYWHLDSCASFILMD